MRLLHCLVHLTVGLTACAVNIHAGPLFFKSVTAFGADPSVQVDLFEHPGGVVEAGAGGDSSQPGFLWPYISIHMGFDMRSASPPGATFRVRLTFDRDVIEPVASPDFPPASRFIEFGLPPLPVGNDVAGAIASVLVSPVATPCIWPCSIEPAEPWPISVTIDILNSAPDYMIPSGRLAGTNVDSYTYSFRIRQRPAFTPEPSMMPLLSAGLVAAIVLHLRRCLFNNN